MTLVEAGVCMGGLEVVEGARLDSMGMKLGGSIGRVGWTG